MKSKQLVIRKNYFSPLVWEQMGRMATIFIQSGAMPSNIKNAQQAIVVMQTGFEMGMKPMEAIKSLYIVNGQVNVWGSALIRRLREHGWGVKYEMSPDRGGSCKATVFKLKGGKESYTESFSYDAADKSGYTKDSYGKLKPGWREGTNRNLKLRYGAVSVIIKSYLSEVLGSANDIAEIAEDYPEIKEEKLMVSKKVEVITGTPEQHQDGLKQLLDKKRETTVILTNKNSPKQNGKSGSTN